MNGMFDSEMEEKGGALRLLCEKYGVATLDLFGSGASDNWHQDASDLDFIVVFQPDGNRGLVDRYLGLADDLEALFGRPVDLLTPDAIRNPYFREAVDATRTRVYAE